MPRQFSLKKFEQEWSPNGVQRVEKAGLFSSPGIYCQTEGDCTAAFEDFEFN